MKFLVDMPLSPNVADWLHKKGHMSVHASQVGLHDAPDAAIMAAAVTDDRVVITADLDYPRLLAMSGANRPSLILFRGGSLLHSIIVVDKNRIRRRPLPI